MSEAENAMAGNPHYEPSENRRGMILDAFMRGGDNTVPNTLALAQLEATLALAFEQRTANLITLWQGQGDMRQEFMDATALEFNDWDALAQTISQRLGIHDGAAK